MSSGRHSLADLQRLAREEELPKSLLPARLQRLSAHDIPEWTTSTYSLRAEQLLSEHKPANATRTSSLMRTHRRKQSSTYKQVTNVLPSAIQQGEPTGVIQALLRRGGEAKCVKDEKIRTLHVAQRSQLLLMAIECENTETIWLLASQASSACLNEALTLVIDHNLEIARNLLQYGADPNACKSQFVAACARRDQNSVALLLSAPICVKSETLLQALSVAVERGCVHLVIMIAEAADLRGQHSIQALEHIRYRHSILLAVLLRAPCLDAPVLDAMVLDTFEAASVNSKEKLKVLDCLFYAGAHGEGSSAAFASAVEKGMDAFIALSIKHHVAISWNGGLVVRNAILAGRADMAELILANGEISERIASDCMQFIPRHLATEQRFRMLRLLLDAGANGAVIDEQLLIAVKNNEKAVVALLRARQSPPAQIEEALVEAIKNTQVDVLRLLLSGTFDPSSLDNTLTYVGRAGREQQLCMSKLLLEAGAGGTPLHAALSDAVCNDTRNDDLVDALLAAGADPTYSNSRSLCHAVSLGDCGLLRRLLQSSAGVSSEQMSSLITEACRIDHALVRFQIMSLIVDFRPRADSITKALCDEFSKDSVYIPLFRLLSKHADVRYDDAKAIVLATSNLDPAPLATIMTSPSLDVVSVRTALTFLLRSSTLHDEQKAHRVSLLLSTKKREDLAYIGLKFHLEHCGLRLPNSSWPLQTFQELLSANPDLSNNSGEVVCLAAKASAVPLLRLLLQKRLSQSIISKALIESVTHGSEARSMADLLVDHKPSVIVLSSALVVAARRGLSSHCQLFLAHGARLDFEAYYAIRLATSRIEMQTLDVFLSGVNEPRALHSAFEEAVMLPTNRRMRPMERLLHAGLRGRIVDEYLVALVSKGNDPALVQLLLGNGADPDFEDGAALCNACARGEYASIANFAKSNPHVKSRSRALHFLAASDSSTLPSEEFCEAIDMLVMRQSTDPAHFLATEQGLEPSIRALLTRRARDPNAVRKALEAGCLGDPSRARDDTMRWGMTLELSPRIRTDCLRLLVDHGANVKHVHDESGESLVILAIRTGRSCLVKSLLQRGADASSIDKQGRSPLLIAVEKQDDLAVWTLLEAPAEVDDGSLHQAVHNLTPGMVRLLLEHGHDPNLPSPFRGHARRTPLGELMKVEADPSKFKPIKNIIDALTLRGADVTKSAEKPLICLALDNSVHMAEAVLRSFPSTNHLDEDYNIYKDGQRCYSPIMYVLKGMCPGSAAEIAEKSTLLKQYGARREVYYALKGPQPDDAIGMPPNCEAAERERRFKVQREAEVEAAHRARLRREQEVAEQQERMQQLNLQNVLAKKAAIATQEEQLVKKQREEQLEYERQQWELVRSQQAERERWKEREKEKELQYDARRNDLLSTQQKETLALQECNRQTLLLQDHAAYEGKLKLEQGWEKDMDGYREKEHKRSMKELTMATAVPIGMPMPMQVGRVPARKPVGAAPGQRFLTMD